MVLLPAKLIYLLFFNFCEFCGFYQFYSQLWIQIGIFLEFHGFLLLLFTITGALRELYVLALISWPALVLFYFPILLLVIFGQYVLTDPLIRCWVMFLFPLEHKQKMAMGNLLLSRSQFLIMTLGIWLLQHFGCVWQLIYKCQWSTWFSLDSWYIMVRGLLDFSFHLIRIIYHFESTFSLVGEKYMY